MKKTTVLAMVVAALAGSSGVVRAAPDEIHAQGVLRDAGGDLMAGQASLVFGIYGSKTGGQPLWQETVTVPLIAGVFDVLLPAAPQTFPFPPTLFDGDDRWLGITPSGQPELPRTRLSSVPYALRADRAADLQCSGCIASNEVSFNYASGDAPGGAAINALVAGESLLTHDVSCQGCVTLQAIDAAVLHAHNVAYDNAVSGLAAATVQDALDLTALTLDAHVANTQIHGGASGGDGGAKVRVISGDADVIPGQTVTEYVHVFGAATPKVYLYLYGMASSEGDAGALSQGSGTVFHSRCAWIGSHAKASSSCAPPTCPEGWADLGITGSVKTGSATSGSDITNSNYSAGYGYSERTCFTSASFPVMQTRCSWTGSHAKSIGTCTPPGCPSGWTSLGVTGNIVTGGSTSGSDITNSNYSTTSGYQERTCVLPVVSKVPQGVQIWLDGVDRTVAIGDQHAQGAPAWTGSSWGADGLTPWAAGRLDISQASDWGVGQHTLQLKTTGASGGRLLFYVYLVHPAATSQPFANEGCAGAQALDLQGGVATVNATTEDVLGENKALDDLSPAGCGGQGGGDVVYSATVTKRSTITASVSAPFATRLYILANPCPAETVLACGTKQAVTAELDPGTYYVVVDADAPDQTGDFILTVSVEASPLPGNDTCATPAVMAAGPVPIQVQGTTKWGLDQYAGSCGGAGVADVVYAFDANNVHDDLAVSITAAFDAVMVLRTSPCPGGVQLACTVTGSFSIPGLAPGTYYLYVDGVGVEDEGPFTLNVTLN